jgi:hypothetical protein
LLFNSDNDEKVYKHEDIDYTIHMIRYNSKSLKDVEMLKPLFTKSLATLERLMEELMVGHLFDRISSMIKDISAESILKILIRCKQMMVYRAQIISLLQIIIIREDKLKELNYFVVKGDLGGLKINDL